jgi:hypothetical protein
MKDLLALFHLSTPLAKLLGLGGAKAIVADSRLTIQQHLISNRCRRREPNLTAVDRMPLGFWQLFLSPLQSSSVTLRATCLMNALLGAVVTPAMCTEGVERWMANST